jgi:uncharacterized membrane protein YedE/YeeE
MTATLDPRVTRPEPTVATAPNRETITLRSLAPYVLVGIFLGIVLVKSEVIYWARIQEMFRFQSFHMYGVLGSALVTAFFSLRLLKRFSVRTRAGDEIALAPKELGSGRRYWIGGSVFGAGWALCGACPGPLFALMGSGESVYVMTAMSALAGTWTYGFLRSHLPH